MSNQIRHEMILASAGSGKTHALVNRYLKLLAMGESPARIIALTFTRKAAGEFLQKIFLRLTEAASDPRAASTLSGHLLIEEQGPAFYRTILLSLVHELGNLQLGTIDSFFARLVGAFPYELGLTRPHRIMDDFEQGQARAQAMEHLMAAGDAEREQHILQIYKELTWGAEEKNVYRMFEDSLKACHSLFLESRDPAIWGRGDLIFTSLPWWMGQDLDKDQLADSIRGDLVELELTPANHNKFETLLDRFLAWQPGQPLDNGVVLQRLMESHADLKAGRADIKIGRADVTIEGPLAGKLFALVQSYVRQEIARRLLTTQSLGKLLAEFDGLYEASVREAGSLVFSDLPMLLVRALCGDGPALAAEDIIYRLDGQTAHWLIDEFQDTSRIQWKVLSSFVDEVLQDPGGRRSFFHVGDIKQSIYGWRGGDSRLFEEIHQRYGAGVAGIQKSFLFESWRSAPPVLDCVNQLFGTAITPAIVGDEVARRWCDQWSQHQPSARTRGLSGHAAWGLVDVEAGLEQACIELLETVQPLAKGLSCAILMRRNTDIIAMTQALRQAGIPASMEGRVHIAMDNVVGTWIRAFFTALARPDETFPADYLSWSGFACDKRLRAELANEVRAALSDHGYAEAVRHLLGFLSGELEMSPFLSRRSEQLLEAATRFEGTGAESLEAFLQFLESATVEESTLASQIQVMTVHKAKGLDFDMVIVAGFGADPLVQPNRNSLHAERSDDGEINWILDLPNKAFLEVEPTLSAAAAGEHARNVFEALCLLYVAMTRARQGLYCLAMTPQRNSSQTTWHQLFETAFVPAHDPVATGAVTWQACFGDAGWHEESQSAVAGPAHRLELAPLPGPLPPVRSFLQRAASPSQESHSEEVFAAELRSNAGRQFGTRVHDWLSLVEWADPADGPALQALLATAPEDLRARMQQLFESPVGRRVFSRPDRPCTLWREKPYVLKRDGRVAHGIIDRAVVFQDLAGRPTNVVIFDYKTDSLDSARPAEEQLLERYALQIERYREAVAALTGLPLDAISAELVPV